MAQAILAQSKAPTASLRVLSTKHCPPISPAMNALGDMKKKALETSISQAEEQVGTMAPGYLKCFFPMCGGPVGTLSKFECAVPADQKDNFNSAKDSYNKAKDELAKM